MAFRWDAPWCVGGDFTVVRFSGEKKGSHRLSGAMRSFSKFIDDMQLLDLPLHGGEFTWGNSQSASRIDRFLVSGDWEEQFHHIRQVRMEHPVSDHWPLLLECGGMRRGPSPFRFENMWLSVEGFREQVKEWWDGYKVRGSLSCVLAKKLKLLKDDLK